MRHHAHAWSTEESAVLKAFEQTIALCFRGRGFRVPLANEARCLLTNGTMTVTCIRAACRHYGEWTIELAGDLCDQTRTWSYIHLIPRGDVIHSRNLASMLFRLAKSLTKDVAAYRPMVEAA